MQDIKQDIKEEEIRFWEELNGLIIQMACLIERKRLGKDVTTADLRKAGKKVLCDLTEHEK